jgi:hypothetical protein
MKNLEIKHFLNENDIDNINKDWIIQLKVNTTRNKLYTIEDKLKKFIMKILDDEI